jgi:ATP-dependent RNA helicase TDRD12
MAEIKILSTLSRDDPVIYSQNIIFSHGNVCAQIVRAHDAMFSTNVRKNIYKIGYSTVRPIQSYSWNEIIQGQSVVMISSRECGKTFGYLPSLLSLIEREIEKSSFDEEEFLRAEYPSTVIFVETSREIQIIHDICARLLTEPKIKIATASGIWNLEESIIKILNGCHILITTPACFMRIRRNINPKKIRRLVFDNFDTMNETFKEELARIFRTFLPVPNDNKIQLIITSSKWQETLRKFFLNSHVKVLLIADFIEAAIMARAQFQIRIDSDEVKGLELAKNLSGGDWMHHKTMIIFNNETELREFEARISDSNAIQYTALVNFSPKKAKIFCNNWHTEPKGRMTLLLITDNDQKTLNLEIHKVQVLIHYSLPQSWTKFSRRFYACIDYFRNYVDVEKLPEKNDERPMIIMLLNCANICDFPRLFRFLQTRQRLEQLSPDVCEKLAVCIEVYCLDD